MKLQTQSGILASIARFSMAKLKNHTWQSKKVDSIRFHVKKRLYLCKRIKLEFFVLTTYKNNILKNES